jgi:hypothetical protein
MPSLLLDGTVTAHSPIAIILAGSEDGKIPAGPPIKSVLRNGVLEKTIYVPASSLRGRLRHLLVAELMYLQHTAGDTLFAPDDYILTALGGVKDRKSDGADERKVDLANIRNLRLRNPVISLFGSMVEGVSGRLMIGDLSPESPIAPVTTGRSTRADPFRRNPELITLLDPDRLKEFHERSEMKAQGKKQEIAEKDLARSIKDAKKRGMEADVIAGLEAEKEELTRNKTRLYRDGGGAVNLQQLLPGYNVLPEGTLLANRIRLIDGTEDEFALLFLALDLLARRPLIGGHLAHGCGEIGGKWSLRVQHGAAAIDAGTVGFDPYGPLVVESSNPVVQQAHQRAMSFGTEVANFDFRVATAAPKPSKKKGAAEHQ